MASIGPLGAAIALWARGADRDPLLARRRRAAQLRPVGARVTVQGTAIEQVAPIADLPLAYCHVQTLPDGHVLIVAARTSPGTDNAMVFDANGQQAGQGNLRDGIAHMRTTASGRIWVGYFDEGVYGDDPVAHHGIVRYDNAFEPEWRYPFDIEVGLIDDCYALNVDGETAWSCFYSGFPIVRIKADRLTSWANPVTGLPHCWQGPGCALWSADTARPSGIESWPATAGIGSNHSASCVSPCQMGRRSRLSGGSSGAAQTCMSLSARRGTGSHSMSCSRTPDRADRAGSSNRRARRTPRLRPTAGARESPWIAPPPAG